MAAGREAAVPGTPSTRRLGREGPGFTAAGEAAHPGTGFSGSNFSQAVSSTRLLLCEEKSETEKSFGRVAPSTAPPWKNQAEPSGPASFPRPLWGTGHPGPRDISLGRFRKECSFATGDNNREENLPAHVVIGLSPGESRRVKRREDVHRFESQQEIKTAAGAASAAGEGPLRGWGAAEAAGVLEGTVPPSAA